MKKAILTLTAVASLIIAVYARTQTENPYPTSSLIAQDDQYNPIVWVNTNSGIYHYKGSAWYGRKS